MRAFSRRVDAVIGTLGFFGSCAIIFVALLSVVEIFRRYILNAPSIWATDLVIAVAAVTYVLAGPYAYLRGRHIEINVFSDRFTGRVRIASEALKALVGAGYVGALLYGSLQMASTSLAGGERTGTAWDVPAPQVIKVVLVAALVLFLLLILRRLLQIAIAASRGSQLPALGQSDDRPEIS